MNDSALIEKLMLFGLTRQEASIYLCLAANRELSGYEASKLTGISRSNVYNALAGLVEKGAAYLLAGSSGRGNPSKYTAVAVEEFCQSKIHALEQTKKALVRDMPGARQESEGYITIAGHQHIMDRIHHMLAHAKYRIYFSLPVDYLEFFRGDILKLLEEGKKVVLLVERAENFPGAIVYRTKQEEAQVRLIADSAYVLTGDMSGSASDTCLYCGQRNFVNVFKESMRNEIQLIELRRKAGGTRGTTGEGETNE